MKYTDFAYVVCAKVELSGRDIQFLLRQSQLHYDSLCQTIGECGPNGFIYGMSVRWAFANELPVGEFPNNERSNATEIFHLSPYELDILAKLCELPGIENPQEVENAYAFFTKTLQACSAEWCRLNPK